MDCHNFETVTFQGDEMLSSFGKDSHDLLEGSSELVHYNVILSRWKSAPWHRYQGRAYF